MENPKQCLRLSDHSRLIKRRQRALRPTRHPSPHRGSMPMAGEDEDMANCLILLAAQGDGPTAQEDHHQGHLAIGELVPEGTIDTDVGSKKVSELGVVYECKTCNKVFPSFQALGGHRASHSKPNKATGMSRDQTNRQRDHDHKRRKFSSVSLRPALGLSGMSIKAKPPRKVHECSVCGSVFASGQALGGHMRRHRSSPVLDSTEPAASDGLSIKPRKILALDLNLPAPEEEDENDSGLEYRSGPDQLVSSPLFMSAGALVDCHY